jgi:DNA-binding beta-propeller fold protein YncE
VSKVTSNGSSYTQFATGFDQPYAIVFDSQNNDFYVSNFGNGTISQITSTGTNTINLPQGSQADAPSGLALDSSGNLYISDFNNGEIYELNTKTNALTTLVSSGLSNPVGLAVDGSGDLFVASNVGSGIISEVSTAGGPLTTIATGIDVPEGLAIQGNNIYVSEVNNGGSTTGSVLVTPIPPPVPFDFSANFVGLSTLGSFWVISRLRSWYKSQSSKLARQ